MDGSIIPTLVIGYKVFHMTSTRYDDHIVKLQQVYTASLEQVNSGGLAIEAVLIHSGSEDHYFADDRAIPFQAYGHFCHWLPVNQPDQFLYFCPGQRPIYFQIVPDDFWYDQSIEVAQWWGDQFQIVRLSLLSEIGRHLPDTTTAYLGSDPDVAKKIGIESLLVNPQPLISYLDFCRAIKTEYELDQLRTANRLALQGHAAARESFLAGANEYEIHQAFLNACNILEQESPYTNIVALDEKSAILHYQHKRRAAVTNSRVLLIDAGCRVNGYGSDVTRTSVNDSAHTVFQSLLAHMEKLELTLVAQIKPGMAYQDLHTSALQGIANLLVAHDLCTGTERDLLAQEIPQLFMPHGVGHLLGIQVHDVGGHQQDISGASSSPPKHSPALRNTRVMEENMVFTVEPGFYFIPILLEPERAQARGKLINWQLVDELYPCGGIRVEDNIRVIADGAENLTRQFEV